MKFSWKYASLAVLGVAMAGLVGWHYSYLVLEPDFKDFKEWLNEKPRTEAEIIHYGKKLQEAYANDYDGGQTPEETLEFWVAAIKDDDLEKASKYFLIDYQKAALEGMRLSKENGVLPDIIEDIENGGSMFKSSAGNSATFETSTREERIEREGNRGFAFRFLKNPETGVWKLEEF